MEYNITYSYSSQLKERLENTNCCCAVAPAATALWDPLANPQPPLLRSHTSRHCTVALLHCLTPTPAAAAPSDLPPLRPCTVAAVTAAAVLWDPLTNPHLPLLRSHTSCHCAITLPAATAPSLPSLWDPLTNPHPPPLRSHTCCHYTVALSHCISPHPPPPHRRTIAAVALGPADKPTPAAAVRPAATAPSHHRYRRCRCSALGPADNPAAATLLHLPLLFCRTRCRPVAPNTTGLSNPLLRCQTNCRSVAPTACKTECTTRCPAAPHAGAL
ncbi:hypothetical protein K438DRAFT_1988872 [Mycena galopus ATCC 62051]|nr:hypothetical protein K438DRAFT_1988872 [Mycena galopus ATCC 62051]